jgi:hypothetical protein
MTGGTVDLTDPLGYDGSYIDTFAAHDFVDLAGSWSLLSGHENSGGTLGGLTLTNERNCMSPAFAGNSMSSDFGIHSGATTILSHA